MQATGTTTAKEVLQGTPFERRQLGRLWQRRSSKAFRVDAGRRDDYSEGGPPRQTVWAQAAGTNEVKEVLQGTPCGRSPPGRNGEEGPPMHTMWTQVAGTTKAKEVLQGTTFGRRPPGRLRRRRSSKVHRVDADRWDDCDGRGPPRHTLWTLAAGTTTAKEVPDLCSKSMGR